MNLKLLIFLFKIKFEFLFLNISWIIALTDIYNKKELDKNAG